MIMTLMNWKRWMLTITDNFVFVTQGKLDSITKSGYYSLK